MKYMILLGSLLTLSFCPSYVVAQEHQVYTLGESISEAFSNNWSLKAKKEKIAQAADSKRQARAEFLPKLSMSYGYTRLDEATTVYIPNLGDLPISSQNNYQWKGTVTQPLFTGFALVSSYELAKLGIDQSEMGLELEKLDLALRVKEAYFGILKAEKAVEVAGKAVESLESHVKVARSFYKVGMIPINDLLKAEVELADAHYNLVKARNSDRLARSAFNTVLSKPIDRAVKVKDIVSYEAEKVNFQKSLDMAFKERPEIRLIDIHLLQAGQQVRLARSKVYPEVTLNYNYIKEGDDPGVSGSLFLKANRWEATAACSWTFWEWGKTYYSVREKQAFRRELKRTRQALKDRIRLEVKEAVLALEEAEKNIPTTRKAIEQAEENLRVSEERYKAQVTTSTEVLDAQTLLTRASRNYYDALYDHSLAKARLQRSLGTY